MKPVDSSRARGVLVMAVVSWTVLTGAILPARAQNPASADPPKPTRPNVLVILADDLGYSDLGFMGSEIATPHLDRLASRGVRFTQCYNSARCCPSRASLTTGLYPHQAGIGSFATSRPSPDKGPAYLGHLNDRCVTMAEVLGDAGYQTLMVGKWHMEEPGPIERGFDEFYGFVHGYEQDQWEPHRYQRLPVGRPLEIPLDDDFYATDAFTEYALEFLDQARSRPDQPWFLYVAHSAPHFPVQAPRDSVAPLVDTYRQGWDQLRQARWERMRASGLADDTWALTDRSIVPVDDQLIANGFSGQPNPAWDDVEPTRREDLAHRMAVFAAMVQHVDTGVGRLLADLEANGELDNTIIFFTSDNGACYEWGPWGFDGPSRQGVTLLHEGDALEAMGGPGSYHAYGSAWANLGNSPLKSYKHFTYEGGNCSPLVVHWPAGIQAPDRWCRQPVHLFDVLPTICDVTGAEYPVERAGHEIQPLEGLSLASLLRDPERELPERPIASEHNGARSLRQGRWKVVWSVRTPWEGKWELYDISADRCETTDLAARHPEVVSELARTWFDWARRVQVHPFREQDEQAVDDPPTPLIANRTIHASCRVRLTDRRNEGVVLAQGGDQLGYAIHIADQKVVLTVRVLREATHITAPLPEANEFKVEAKLLSDGSLELWLDGQRVAAGPGLGLLPREPQDRLCVGRDDQSSVGDYDGPFTFSGRVESVEVSTQLVD